MSEGHTPKQSLKMHAVDLGKVLCVCAWGESRDSPVRYSVELMSLNDKESTGSPHNLVLQKRIHNDHWNGWAFVDAQQLNPVKSVISLEMLKKERTKSATAGHFQNEINSGGRNGIIIFWYGYMSFRVQCPAFKRHGCGLAWCGEILGFRKAATWNL